MLRLSPDPRPAVVGQVDATAVEIEAWARAHGVAWDGDVAAVNQARRDRGLKAFRRVFAAGAFTPGAFAAAARRGAA